MVLLLLFSTISDLYDYMYIYFVFLQQSTQNVVFGVKECFLILITGYSSDPNTYISFSKFLCLHFSDMFYLVSLAVLVLII